MPCTTRSHKAVSSFPSQSTALSSNKVAVSVAQFNIDARRAFEALLPGLSKAEMGKTPFVLERLPWLQNWWKGLNANHVENLRTKGQYKAQAKKAAEPLIQMVCFCDSMYCFEASNRHSFRRNTSPIAGGFIFLPSLSTPAAETPSRLRDHAKWSKFASRMGRVLAALWGI
jgi:hypothetical protein